MYSTGCAWSFLLKSSMNSALCHPRKTFGKDIVNFLTRFFMYFIQHCFLCHPSDSTVSEDTGIEPRTAAIFSIASQTL